MLPFEEALRIVLDSARRLDSERVEIAHSVNRILAEDVKSDMDMPPFDRAVVDGYTCRREDLANELTIIEKIRAGMSPKKEVGPNQCIKIMTGAPVPKGADCVVMVEFTENPTEGTVRFVGEKTDDHIRPQGEDIRTGQVILLKGTRIKPQHIAVLASVGQVRPLVTKKPRVAVIATGNELVEPGLKPAPSQIRNSNSPQLAAQLESVGTVVRDYGIAGDTVDDIDSVFKRAAAENNVIIISGGVSMGDFDFVPGILRQNNVELLFEKIAFKPGKPTVFGISDKVYCFGLPGNPVSTFAVFELLVKPFLYKLMGHAYAPANIQMPLGESIRSTDIKRQNWIPVAITEAGTLEHIEYHGSAHIGALRTADGLVGIGAGAAEIPKGTIVQVRLI
jgi:molybdopterin molybdotransferase